jgi:hypothetical protein
MTSPRKTASPELKISHLLLPKRGHTLAECEDAFACNRSTMRFAVADGATEAFDSASWAQRLATRWVNATGLLNPEDFWTWLKNEGQAHNDSWNRLDLPWYSMEKRRAGSFAAFVGVEIQLGHESQSWKGVALGDSCLVHSRNAAVQVMFPLSNSTDFGSAPVLAPSCAEINAHAQSAIALQTGEILEGDKLLLLSDATAAWYLKLCEQKDHKTKSDFEVLLDEDDETAISDFLELERSTRRLKDDDVAIVCIEF